MGARYEIRPGDANPGRARYATHSEVLLALKTTAKEMGTSPKLPAGKRGDHWRASIEGLVVVGSTRRSPSNDHELETFYIEGAGVDHDALMMLAAKIAGIAGKQAVIGDTEDEFWFVEPAAAKKKKKKAKK